METRTVEQVESWSTRSFADGFAGLRELSDGEFSGTVRANGAWLFMLNGRIIGVYEGSLDDFEDADGTAYAAPHPSLPLVFSMQEQGGDTRAKYYTNDTPLSEVDSTLTDGSFTGYVELSENVLSGDYYVAYYGGRSMSVAFVGASEQVVTGDEAFERAADEVGIYEVTDVDLEVTDVPEPEESDEPDAGADSPSSPPAGGSSETAGSGSAGVGKTGPADGPGGQAEPGTSQPSPDESPADRASAGRSSTSQSSAGQSSGGQSPTAESSAGRSPAGERSEETTAAESGASSTADSQESRSATDAIRQPEAEGGTTDAERTAETSAETAAESTPAESGSSAETTTETTDAAASRDDAGASRDGATPSRDSATSTRESSTTTGDDATGRTGSADAGSDSASDDEADAFSEEAEWRETTTIPSLDPDRSEGPDEKKSRQGSASTGSASTGSASTGATSPGSASGTGSTSSESANRTADAGSATSGGRSASSESGGAKRQSSGQGAGSPGADSSKSSGSAEGKPSGAGESGGDDARERIQKLRSQLKQRKQQVQQLKERLSTVESERNEFERERDALRQEVERLEAKLETVSSGGSSADGRQLSSAQAFDGTNLFVRYESKGEATLEEAAAGEADLEDVNANLRLEHHTQFETDDATVEGRAFEEFLADSFEYRFVSWIIEDLLYEIRDTGHRSSLRDLYESIPKIDRVDLHGTVSAGGEDEDTRKEEFDVIARDRMGNPLLVADLNDSRDPTTGDMMGSLVDAASGVGEAHDELSGAFQVTESFFEPEALETADTATTGGFLSREKRESFVKLSRKRGYHLCLVESRSGGFHLNVPEL
ncbi:transcriptional regulator [Halobacteriales archaeon SW_6_65_15]|nr:MAG: transcriptional regulator [Halobacteriales archaeon SW_6_65_15]